MLEGPSGRGQLGEATEGPARLELGDDVLEVGLGVDAAEQAAVGQGEGDGEAFPAADGAGEVETPACGGEEPDSSFDATVVDLEAAVVEAAAEEVALVDGVGGRSTQRRLGQQLRVDEPDRVVRGTSDRDW